MIMLQECTVHLFALRLSLWSDWIITTVVNVHTMLIVVHLLLIHPHLSLDVLLLFAVLFSPSHMEVMWSMLWRSNIHTHLCVLLLLEILRVLKIIKVLLQSLSRGSCIQIAAVLMIWLCLVMHMAARDINHHVSVQIIKSGTIPLIGIINRFWCPWEFYEKFGQDYMIYLPSLWRFLLTFREFWMMQWDPKGPQALIGERFANE